MDACRCYAPCHPGLLAAKIRMGCVNIRYGAGAGLVIALLCMGLLSGCAQTHSTLRYEVASITPGAQRVVWPPAPEIPRYRYVGELTGEDNIHHDDSGIAGAGVKALKWLVGLLSEKNPAIILQRPQAGAVDNNGRIYVTDVSRQAVYVFDEKKGDLQVWEMAEENVRFEIPIGIAVGVNGEILVADAALGQVFRLNSAGVPVGSFGKGLLKHPTGVARDALHGRVYVADTHLHQIRVFDDVGNVLATFGAGQRSEAPGEFNSPTHLAFADGKLYVADTLNARVQVLAVIDPAPAPGIQPGLAIMDPAPGGQPGLAGASPAGSVIAPRSGLEAKVLQVFGRRGLFVGDLTRPKGVTVDATGNIYVIESYYDHLLVFNSQGEFLLPIGGGGSGTGQFVLPAGVWSDQRGRIYVADMFNGRVVVFEYLGEGA